MVVFPFRSQHRPAIGRAAQPRPRQENILVQKSLQIVPVNRNTMSNPARGVGTPVQPLQLQLDIPVPEPSVESDVSNSTLAAARR